MTNEPLLPPTDDPESAPFWEGTRAGALRVQQCPVTERLIFPPRALSPWAPGAEPRWTTVSGRGTIWSYVVPHPPLLPWYAERAPYNVIAVALDEDPNVRLIGNLVEEGGSDLVSVDPAAVEIGVPVRVVFDRISGEVVLPRWVRV